MMFSLFWLLTLVCTIYQDHMTNVDAKDPGILIFLTAVCVSSVSVCLFVGEMLNAGGWGYDDNHDYSFIFGTNIKTRLVVEKL